MKSVISIIIPVYNVEKYIDRCIDHVLVQSYTDFELILVDDSSNDASLSHCKKYALIDSRVKVYTKKNDGAGYARNYGLDHAEGKYVMFIDSDDYILPGCLERMMEVANKEKCGIVTVKHFTGSEQNYSVHNANKPYTVISSNEAFESRNVNISIWGKLYRKEVIGDIRYPNVSTHDDEFMTYKLIYAAKTIAVLDEAYYYYYTNPESIMHQKRREQPLYFMNAYKERISYFEQRGEKKLVEISHKEYAIRLMLAYCNRRQYEVSKLSNEEAISEFKKEYELGKKTISTAKEKISLRLFFLWPGLMSKVYAVL